jgi:hypothetical protein
MTAALWRAVQAFGQDAVRAVAGSADDHDRVLDREMLRAIAGCAKTCFWVTERSVSVWEIAGAERLSALQAFDEFGLDVLFDARERGGVELSKIGRE